MKPSKDLEGYINNCVATNMPNTNIYKMALLAKKAYEIKSVVEEHNA